IWGTIFFYGTCWWLTYPIIHYAHISAWLAYPALALPVIFVGLFPALACGLLSRLIRSFGSGAIMLAPGIWISCDSLRYAVTGQIWNGLGYSQAFHPVFVQAARWGGVYAISFALVTANVAIVLAITRPTAWRLLASGLVLATVFVV